MPGSKVQTLYACDSRQSPGVWLPPDPDLEGAGGHRAEPRDASSSAESWTPRGPPSWQHKQGELAAKEASPIGIPDTHLQWLIVWPSGGSEAQWFKAQGFLGSVDLGSNLTSVTFFPLTTFFLYKSWFSYP